MPRANTIKTNSFKGSSKLIILTLAHFLDLYKKQIELWHGQGYSSVVIHRLLQDKCRCDIQALRRYRQKHFPSHIEPVMVRSTVAGQDLEVDFGELGRFYDEKGQLVRMWLFSLRLRHSGKAYREIVTDQKLQTFLKSGELVMGFTK
jgi:hypothetical protein